LSRRASTRGTVLIAGAANISVGAIDGCIKVVLQP
jgi:hypothetical protein